MSKMKFFLIAAIVLMPLVTADLAPQTFSKLLFSDGYFISESFDAGLLHYKLYGDSLEVKTYSNSKYGYQSVELQGNLKERRFAVVSFSKFDPNQEFCRLESTESLRDLIQSCYGKIILRNLTQDEEKQLQTFKEEYAKNKNPFKVVVDGREKSIKSQSVSQKVLKLENMKRSSEFEVFATPSDNWKTRIMMLTKSESMKSRPFVIEGLPSGSGVNCFETDIPDLKPWHCQNDIRLRSVNSDD